MVTRSTGPDERLADQIEALAGVRPVAWANHAWTHLVRWSPDGARESVGIDVLRGRRVALCLGIGHPEAMERQIASAGAAVVYRAPVRDHHAYTPQFLRMIAERAGGAEAIVTTGKDWVKIRPILADVPLSIPLLVPALKLDVHTGSEALRAMLRTLGRSLPG